MGTGEPGSMPKVYVSFAEPDQGWAAWLTWQLSGRGYEVMFEPWDVVPGENLAGWLDRALSSAAYVVVVLSRHYLERKATAAEWTAAPFAGDRSRLVPVKIDDCDSPGLLSTIAPIDVAGRSEDSARATLYAGFEAVGRGHNRPDTQPPFPGVPSRSAPAAGTGALGEPTQGAFGGPNRPGLADELLGEAGIPEAAGGKTRAAGGFVPESSDGDSDGDRERRQRWLGDAAPPILTGQAGGGPVTRRRRLAKLRPVAIAAAVVVLIAAAGTVAVLRTHGGTASSPVPNVALQPIGTGGDNPFMPSVGDDVQGTTPPADVHGALAADTPGLFGGTRDTARCDQAKMVTFLKAHPDLLAAWSTVLGIQPADLDSYVAGLTPVVLRADTAVTNHGFRDGRPTAVPAVLQAGTAVLVDQHGAPVVKCFCGNPLTPPARYSTVRYTGPRWTGFSEQKVTSIQTTTTTINVFILIDVRTGKPFQRPAGTDGAQDRPYTRTTDIDWRNTSYTTDCDGSAGSMTVNVRNGTGVASRAGRTYNLEVVTVTSGELAGDRDPETAVLLSCHPEPSNFFVTEIQVFRTGPEPMAALDPPEAAAPLSPAYFDDAVAIQDSRLYTRVHAYDSSHGDSHASGPSAYQDISWQWNGQRFVPRVDATSTQPPPATPSPQQTATHDVPEIFLGSWNGVIAQTNPPVPDYSLSVTIRQGVVGSTIASGTYTIPCSVHWTLLSAENGQLVVNEVVDSGNCLNNIQITLTDLGDGTLSYIFEGGNGRGVLRR